MLELFGGPDRDRTDDLFHAMEARSQLRHRPTIAGGDNFSIFAVAGRFVKPGHPEAPLNEWRADSQSPAPNWQTGVLLNHV
jgi:hypothetical protein